MREKHPVDIAAYEAGSETELAAALGVTPQAVSNWRKTAIPINRCGAIFTRFGVPLWQLRPDDWHEHWPMLIGTKGAPAVPTKTA
jgi:DNA-binding transcriptional regulator YdaS (Cro superfamily)